MIWKTLGPALLAFGIAMPAIGADKVREVETGLTPAVTIKGEATPKYRIEDRMRRYKVPGLTIAVIDQGKIVWTKAYGVVTAGSAEMVQTDTRFQAASISKPVTAMAVHSLVVEGKISLDKPVNARLKGWQVPPSDVAPGYVPTLRALLSHSAGMSTPGFGGYAVGTPIPTVIQVLNGEAPANSPPVRIEKKPGEFSYSGGGLTIVQKYLADATGTPFADLVRKRVLGPVGMTHSTFSVPDQNDQSFATAHKSDGSALEGRWHIYPELAAAGLWTTSEDLAKFGLAVLRAKKGDARAGFDPRAAALILERQPGLTIGGAGYKPAIDTANIDASSTGLGFRLSKEGEPPTFSHGGGNAGFRCMLVIHSASNQGIAVMTNSDNGLSLIAEIVRSVINAYGWPNEPQEVVTAVKPDPAAQNRFVGAFTAKRFPEPIVFRVANGDLIAKYGDGHESHLRAESAERFVDTEDGMVFALTTDPAAIDMITPIGNIALHRQ